MSTRTLIASLEARGLLIFVERAAREHHATVADVLDRKRTLSVVAARRAACVALRERGLSYPEIGSLMGRDHRSIMTLIKGRERKEAHV